MSRTYRRKNVPFHCSEDEALKVHPHIHLENGWAYYDSVEEYKEALNKFYTDHGWHSHYGFSLGGVPSWFVNMYCHRPRRRKNKAFCKQVLRLTDYNDVKEPVVYVKDAGWLWW